MKARYLFVLFAVIVSCYAQGGDPNHPNTPCTADSDCHPPICAHESHAVCDISKRCHCHEYGLINCATDSDCIVPCASFTTTLHTPCCFNEHHCHCTDGCQGEEVSCASDSECFPPVCPNQAGAHCGGNGICHCH